MLLSMRLPAFLMYSSSSSSFMKYKICINTFFSLLPVLILYHILLLIISLFPEQGSHDKYKSLHDEAARSSENVIQDPRMQEKKRLLEERSRLENENRLLELQNQAYFMMIQNDKNPAGDEAD